MFIFRLHPATLTAALVPILAQAAPLTLDEALDLAIRRSESARSARAAVSSADESARASGQLPDPTLQAGVDNLPVTGPDRLHTARDSMTMKRIGISQEWLSRDKRAASRAAADASTAREAALVQAAVAETRLQTALAYVDALYAAEALKLTTLMEHHAREELAASKSRLASSTGSSQEVLALAGARALAEDDSAEVRQQQGVAAVALQRWAGVAEAELAALPPAAPIPEEAYLAAHPTLLTMAREVELARRVAAATATRRSPNWTWNVSYGQRIGYSDMLTFGVSIPLQVAPGERQDRDTAAKLAQVAKAEADLAEARRAAAAEYRSLRSDAERLQERAARYQAGGVVAASQRTAAATAAYGSNQSSLVVLFEARRAEVVARLKLLKLQQELARTQARIAYRVVAAGSTP